MTIILFNCIIMVESPLDKLLPNIFDAFVSSNSESRGSGLGLYIAYYYSNLLGYKIEVNNIVSGVKATLHLHRIFI